MKSKLATQRRPASSRSLIEDRQRGLARIEERPPGEEPIGRRRFLKALGMAAAAPLFVPASALGRAGTVAPSERIAIGMIGTGNQGTYHTRILCGAPEAQVVAVCDPVQTKRDAARRLAENASAQRRSAGSSAGCADYNDF